MPPVVDEISNIAAPDNVVVPIPTWAEARFEIRFTARKIMRTILRIAFRFSGSILKVVTSYIKSGQFWEILLTEKEYRLTI
ncbi:hypothetical protein BST85_05255 [Aureitalea marina]|uniref:Uncharacterized protein n=1 Tax=Aureitalea marina TaxID=930804 RepID=A0A2S7KP39_9FLAO|nr:hypothetical protein BST85_05255 [Aureitalea marina]